jgi:hypothetical protein
MARKKKEKSLTLEDKQEILEMDNSGVPLSVIAKKFRISRQAVWEIVRRLPPAPPPLPIPTSNGKEIVDLDLGSIISNLRRLESEWRPVVPPSMVIPVPAWVALEIARSLYREGILSRQDYENWLDKNTRKK